MKKGICYCVDENIKQNNLLYCSLTSLRKYNDNIDVYILTLKNNKNIIKYHENIIYIDERYNDLYYNINKRYFDPQSKKYFRPDITSFTYVKFEIPIIFNDYDKILYLDCDTEIVRNIDPVFDVDTSNYDIIGQKNKNNLVPYFKKTCYENNIMYCKDVVDNMNSCICAGVMLFDIKNIHNRYESYKDYVSQIVESEIKNSDVHKYQDEFLFNCCMKCNVNNILNSTEEERQTGIPKDNTYIIHYFINTKNIMLSKYKGIL